jgi:hypothetical protein
VQRRAVARQKPKAAHHESDEEHDGKDHDGQRDGIDEGDNTADVEETPNGPSESDGGGSWPRPEDDLWLPPRDGGGDGRTEGRKRAELPEARVRHRWLGSHDLLVKSISGAGRRLCTIEQTSVAARLAAWRRCAGMHRRSGRRGIE